MITHDGCPALHSAGWSRARGFAPVVHILKDPPLTYVTVADATRVEYLKYLDAWRQVPRNMLATLPPCEATQQWDASQ